MIEFWKTKNFKMFTDQTIHMRTFLKSIIQGGVLSEASKTDFVSNAGINWTTIREASHMEKSQSSSQSYGNFHSFVTFCLEGFLKARFNDIFIIELRAFF